MKPSDYVAKGWCQGVSAIDSKGRPCMADDSCAVKWCLVGAMTAAYPEHNLHRGKVTTRLIKKIGHLGFAIWNDDTKRTQKEVVDLLVSIGE